MTKTISADFVGRVSNISLAPSSSNALVPLFEAITNAVQAIEDRVGSNAMSTGRVDVEVLRSTKDGLVDGFIVSDNGIGLTPENMESFLRSDSRYKLQRGGKGVGRFMWLKVFGAAHIESRFGSDPDETLAFDFLLSETGQIQNEGASKRATIGTTITLAPILPVYRSVIPSKMEAIQAKIIGHFLPLFLNTNAPKINIIDNGTESDLAEVFGSLIKDVEGHRFEIHHNGADLEFKMNCFLLPVKITDDEKGVNAIFYGANGRSVWRVPIDSKIGLKAIQNEYAFCAFVSGEYLDQHVNQERTGFSWPDDLRKEVHSSCLNHALTFLDEYIQVIRQKQAERVAHLLNEHLRFMTVVDDPAKFALTLELSTQSEEEVFIELSRVARRKEKSVRKAYRDAKKKKIDVDAQVKAYARQINKESMASLAEYVYKRKLILNIFDDHLKFTDADKGRYELEEVVHELICPLRSTKGDLGYDDHNLWIVDDQLAFYSYFNSDKTLKSITGGSDPSTQEPDVTFFDLGIGLDRRGTSDPVNIIEFKRPMRDDYTLSNNPIIQIREYCSRIRDAKQIVAHDGRELRAIDNNTPFTGHIIADITPSLEKMMKQFGPYTQKAGHRCYYKWDDDFHMFIQIQSYQDVLRGAKARNEAFFQRLGLET